jgi:hypothetical protein
MMYCKIQNVPKVRMSTQNGGIGEQKVRIYTS